MDPKAMMGMLARLLAALLLVAWTAPAAGKVEVLGTLAAEEQAAVLAMAGVADGVWNARDAEAMGALYADDGTLALVDRGLVLQGRAAVLDYFRSSLGQVPANFSHHTTVERLIVLAPDLVLADNQVELRAAEAAGPRVVRRFYTLSVLRRQAAGSWRMQAVRAHVLAPPAAAATTAAR